MLALVDPDEETVTDTDAFTVEEIVAEGLGEREEIFILADGVIVWTVDGEETTE